jgi:hypothetical protein
MGDAPHMTDDVVNGKAVYLSRHAIEACIARGFTLDQVFDTLRGWENRYVQSRRYGQEGTTPFMYQLGDMGVGVAETDALIIVKTVLLRERRQWTNEDARAARRARVIASAPAPL